MSKVVTFGEILLRLASPGYNRLFQKDILETSFCGGEANVAVSLSVFGEESVFVTKLPENDVGRAAEKILNSFSVDTSQIVYGKGRMGLYFLEKGASQRPSKVIYDREYSAISLACKDDFNWEEIFEDADWFHFTGINPALSQNVSDICLQACHVAKAKGITISCDLNFRRKLWSCNQARVIMPQLMQYVDVCFANEEDADMMLGIKAGETNVFVGKLDTNSYTEVARRIAKEYGCKYVAITLRESYSASRNGWSAVLHNDMRDKITFSNKYDIQLVDRVGGGDSFSAGIIYALLNGYDDEHVINFAVAASCLKQTMEGDFNRSSVDEVLNLMNSGGSGRVQR